MLLVGGFWGYGYYTRHQPTTYSRGGAFNAGVTQRTPTKAREDRTGRDPGKTRAGKASSHGGKGKSATQRSGATTTSTVQAAQTTRSGGQPHAGSSSAPMTTSSPTVVTPRQGTYTLAVNGSERVRFGPVTGCNNTFPNRATLDVHHADGESATSYDFDLRLYPGSPNKHDERHIYRYSANQVVLTYEEATVTCSGVKQSTTVDYSPAQVRVELPLRVGASWHNKGGGVDRTETGTSKVVSKTALSVAGHSYPVYEIVTSLTMSGKESGSRSQTWWYSPDLGMPLKFAEHETGKRSGATYTDDYTATVVGLP